MKAKIFNKKYNLPLSYLLQVKSLILIVFVWLLVYFIQMSNFMLSSLKESNVFEIFAVFHSVLFVLFVVVFSLRSKGITALLLFMQIIASSLLIISYTYGYQIISGTYFVPNASDALLYNDFAISAIKDGLLATINSFLEDHGGADLGASLYVYIIYLILPDTPLSVYFINLFFALWLIFILKINVENKKFRVLRLTLLINPFLFFLIITSFKELPMICFLALALKLFSEKKWLKSTLFFLLLFLFRPAISALFLAAILLNVASKNAQLIITKFKVNRKVLLIFPITLVFIATFPLLLNFLQSGLLATLDYYRDSTALSSYSIPVAFAASFITGFLGPLYKPYTLGAFSLGGLYSFFYPICMFLNIFCFLYIKSKRKVMNDLQITLFIFILLGLLSISVMLRGFELRYTLVFYIALWWLSASIYSGLTANHIHNRINQ